MVAEFAFTSLHDAALQLNAAARAAKVKPHPLPYRRFEPEAEDTWWLAPTTDNPAYADGKIVVERPTEATPGASIIGLHVEKGVGPAAASAFEESARGSRLVMNEGWIWRAFTREMETGRVEHDLVAAEEAAGELPLLLLFRQAVVDVPRLEAFEDRDRFAAELLWYQLSGGKLDLLGAHQPDVLASTLDRTETLPSIAEKLRAVKYIDWRWVEVIVGIPFHQVPSGGLSASEVWDHACAPWLGWVR